MYIYNVEAFILFKCLPLPTGPAYTTIQKFSWPGEYQHILNSFPKFDWGSVGWSYLARGWIDIWLWWRKNLCKNTYLRMDPPIPPECRPDHRRPQYVKRFYLERYKCNFTKCEIFFSLLLENQLLLPPDHTY